MDNNKEKLLEQAILQIEKQFGKGSIMKLGDNVETQIENFSGISFMMSMPTASPEEQAKFKAWSKFWATLTKFGYNVK